MSFNPSQMVGQQICFSKIITDIVPSWLCVNTHLNASDQQFAKTSAFIEVLYTDDQLIQRVSSSRVLPGSVLNWVSLGKYAQPYCGVVVFIKKKDKSIAHLKQHKLIKKLYRYNNDLIIIIIITVKLWFGSVVCNSRLIWISVQHKRNLGSGEIIKLQLFEISAFLLI